MQIRLSRFLPAFALAGFLAGCAPGANLAALPDYTPGAYKLGGGDQLRIITFGNDQLTGQFRVDDQGTIAMPLIGNVQASGLTPSELAGQLSDTLKQQKFLKDPSVSVEVLAYRPIFVLGEVSKPGQYAYQPGMTVLTAVAVAGGYTYRAFQDYASDIRTSNGHAEEGRVKPQSFLAPGDVIKIYERHF
jgi:polysaccharide export outer membrane protein